MHRIDRADIAEQLVKPLLVTLASDEDTGCVPAALLQLPSQCLGKAVGDSRCGQLGAAPCCWLWAGSALGIKLILGVY